MTRLVRNETLVRNVLARMGVEPRKEHELQDTTG